MTNVKLLNQQIKNSGFKKSYIAEQLNLTPAGFTKKLKGETEFKASEIVLLCDLLKINSSELRDKIFFTKSGA